MVLEKKEEVTALEMRLQALDKDLDWKKEVTVFFFFFCNKGLHKYSRTPIWRTSIRLNLSFVVPLFKGHLHSGGTKFVPGKMLR